MTYLVDVDEVPESARQHSEIEFIDDDTIVVRYHGESGRMFVETFTRDEVNQVVEESDGMCKTPSSAVALAPGRTPEEVEAIRKEVNGE